MEGEVQVGDEGGGGVEVEECVGVEGVKGGGDEKVGGGKGMRLLKW